MLSMISYLNLSSGVYMPLYWFFAIKIFNIYCFFKPNWWMLKIWSPNHHWTVPSMKWISLYHLYAAYMMWISGGFFVKKHLTQGTLSCLIPPPLGKILNFAPTILQSPWLARGPTPGASRWHVHYTHGKLSDDPLEHFHMIPCQVSMIDCQNVAPKSVLHVQHDYLSSFNQSNHWFVVLSLTLPSSNLKFRSTGLQDNLTKQLQNSTINTAHHLWQLTHKKQPTAKIINQET